jgi:hypothetical protein
MEYGTAISPTVASMRHEKDLGIMIQAADVAMSKRNVAVIQGQHGEANRPVEWNVSTFRFAFFPRTSYSHKLQKLGLYFKLGTKLTPQWDGPSAHPII